VNRGCSDMSGVIGLLLEGVEASDDGRIADDKSWTLMSRFPRRLDQCTDARNASPILPFPPLLAASGAASRREGSLRITMAPETRSLALPALPDFSASSRMSGRQSRCYPTILLLAKAPGCGRSFSACWPGCLARSQRAAQSGRRSARPDGGCGVSIEGRVPCHLLS
jgi:hypothetical protein